MWYRKVICSITVLLVGWTAFAQESYNTCSNAYELCPGKTATLNNIGANATVCANCEDDFTFCFSGENTVWMRFTTNAAGGDVNVQFSNLSFQNATGQGTALQAALLSATLPCISSSYSLVSNCVSNGTSNFALNVIGLLSNTTYFVVVNGAMGATSNAEATFDVLLSGTGVNRNPTFTISTPQTAICLGQSVTLTAHTTGCPNQSVFTWLVNGAVVGTTMDSTFTYNQLKDNDIVTAKVTCFSSCKDTLTGTPIVFSVDSFLVDAGEDRYISQGESVKLNGQTTAGSVLWSPSVAMNNPTFVQPVVQPQETTTYFLTADNGTCTITDEVTVFVKKGLVIPNTITPNGDGINDEWEILGMDDFPNCEIEVFDRWGQLVFQTTGYPDNKRWDGTSRTGRKLAAGAYYYVINLRKSENENDAPIKGVVSIIH